MPLAALPNAVLFAVVGIVMLGVALMTLLRLLPGRLWDRALEENSLAAAVIIAAITLALGWIIAAAVH